MRPTELRCHRYRGRKYSSRFNIRLGETLHERLAIESTKEKESLNSFCMKVPRDGVGL